MADKITVSTQVLNDTAAEMRNINNKLNDRLTYISTEVDNLQSTWVSDGGNEIRATMKAMKPRFDQFYEIVDSYGKFLDKTAETYEMSESTIVSNASAFR